MTIQFVRAFVAIAAFSIYAMIVSLVPCTVLAGSLFPMQSAGRINLPVVSANGKRQIDDRSVSYDDNLYDFRSKLMRNIARNIRFWTKATKIYSSYKGFQIRLALSKAKATIRKPIGRFSEVDGVFNSSKCLSVCNMDDDRLWDEIHELNSKRLLDLCLEMRGFYLKTGQFLGTRRDFMPDQYTSKLTKLHDSVPPFSGALIRKIIEADMNGPIEEFFSSFNLSAPIGSASIAQVHIATWKKTGAKVAVKVQYPNVEQVMTSDLRNIRMLAEFLQRTELKFDLLSAIKELQKQISNEFNFAAEAVNMDTMKSALKQSVPEVTIPQSVWVGSKVLVIEYIPGQNLCQLAQYQSSLSHNTLASSKLGVKRMFGNKLLKTLGKAWGYQIFELQTFQADPHPGNINIGPRGEIGLLDWGQVKKISSDLLTRFAFMIKALSKANNDIEIIAQFKNLGVVLARYDDPANVVALAQSMLDTRVVPGYIVDPFNPSSALKSNSVQRMPSELYFLIRTIQLLRGVAFGFGLDFSLAECWAPYADSYLKRTNRHI